MPGRSARSKAHGLWLHARMGHVMGHVMGYVTLI